MEALIFLVAFFVLLLLGVPIVFVLGLLGACFFLIEGLSLSAVISTMFSGMENFVFLAIPFFILAAELMNEIGMIDNLLKFCNLLVGRIRGGLAMVNIVASVFFAALTGSATSDTAALGSVLIPAMEKDGYSTAYSCAVTASSSIIGPIIPPSIMMIIIAVTNDLSVGGLFAAGFIPGILLGLALMALAYYYAWKEKHASHAVPITPRVVATTTSNAMTALMMPIIILGGIFGGVFTPTEAAAVAVAYAFLVGLITRRLTFRGLLSAVGKSIRVTALILLIIGTASCLAFTLSFYLIPQKLTAAVLAVAGTPPLFMLMSILILLVAGCLMESAAIIVILTPMLMAGAFPLGLNPLHFGFIMGMALCIGLVTPPVGLCLFVASGVAKISVERISRAIFPFVLAEMGILFCCAYWPGMVLFIPKLLGYA